MGFFKRNWEKISADTISGVLVRLIPVLLLGFVGIAGYKFISTQPADGTTTKEIIALIYRVIFLVYLFLLFNLTEILQWWGDRKQDKIKTLALENENLRRGEHLIVITIKWLRSILLRQNRTSPPAKVEVRIATASHPRLTR